jgi:hypothetical protein
VKTPPTGREPYNPYPWLVRSGDPPIWTARYALWSMFRHPGVALLLIMWGVTMGTVLGATIALPVAWVTKEFVAPILHASRKDAAEAVVYGFMLLGALGGLRLAFAMAHEPGWWVSRRGRIRR